MDPITIATLVSSAVSALIPFLKKGGEKLADKIVEEGFAKRGELWQTVKGFFSGGDMTTLDLFAEDPENSDKQADVRSELKQFLKANPEKAQVLDDLVKQIPQIKINTMTQTGDGNIGIQDTTGSTITINK